MTENPDKTPTEPVADGRLAVLNKVRCPPGGWSWTDPDTGVRIATLGYSDLIQRIDTYLKANKIPQGEEWRLFIEDDICRQNNIEDSHCGEPTKPEKIPSDRKLQPQDLLNFLRTVRQWAAKGFKFVAAEESERRAAICAKCPKNVEVAGCSGCQGILSHVRSTLNRRANHRGLVAKVTSVDADLQNCEVCGCVLEVKVHLPMEVATYAKPPGGRTYPDWCWMGENQS